MNVQRLLRWCGHSRSAVSAVPRQWTSRTERRYIFGCLMCYVTFLFYFYSACLCLHLYFICLLWRVNVRIFIGTQSMTIGRYQQPWVGTLETFQVETARRDPRRIGPRPRRRDRDHIPANSRWLATERRCCLDAVAETGTHWVILRIEEQCR